MNINRHNYEEFFLLYVDNELTAEQKTSVEQFVQENPDLAIELEILQQTKLPADDSIAFDGKEMLLKKDSGSVINMENYEEYLISYIDDELNDAERMEFFRFASVHPQVQEELSIYRQTKLQPEKEIVFENKQVLYRKEEKVRVVTIQWWKIAVAAVIILAIGITTVTVLNKNNTTIPSQVVKSNQPKQDNITSPKTEQDIKKGEQSNPAIIPENNEVASVITEEKKTKNNPVPKTREEKVQQNIKVQNIEERNELIAVNTPVIRKEEAVIENNSTGNSDNVTTKKSVEPVTTNTIAANTNLPKENINNKAVTPATDKPLDIKEAPLYASYDEGKNKKTRGFFRKAARVFERTTNIASNDEDKEDKILIGALAVKLK